MAQYEIPLSPNSQSFQIAILGTMYNMRVMWNVAMSSWILDIADANNTPILNGIPLVTGTDLLAPYAYLNFGGTLTVFTDGDLDAVPTYSNLGINSHLYFTTT